MMKKLGVILLALCMFSVSVFADEQTFNPTVDVQRSEVQMDIPFIGGNRFSPSSCDHSLFVFFPE